MNPRWDPWIANWAFGLPLIALNVVIHVCGLAIIAENGVRVATGASGRRPFMPKFVAVMGTTALLVAILHGIEAASWAVSYRLIGALPDNRSAMLYSLSAITSYGHASVMLDSHWQLMGALEALNGVVLFGLTTAFLFAMIQMVWPLGVRDGRN